jgi:TonB family protein
VTVLEPGVQYPASNAMRFALANCIRLSFGVLLVAALCPSMSAQEYQINLLANEIAKSLSQSKQKTVVVFDFHGTDEWEVLGQKLAADFDAALAKSAVDFQVKDRLGLLEVLQNKGFTPSTILDGDAASWVLQQTGVDASIVGTMSNGIGGLKLFVEAYRVADSYPIASFEASIPLTEDLKTLIGQEVKDEFASVPKAGKNGYSSPSCAYCPQPQFSDEAVKSLSQGTVLLDVTIDENGHARDIRIKGLHSRHYPFAPNVRRGPSYNLAQQAIDAVRRWRLNPATGPDGKPVAVRQQVEITFFLN